MIPDLVSAMENLASYVGNNLKKKKIKQKTTTKKLFCFKNLGKSMNLGPKVQQYCRSLFQWSQCRNDPYTVQADVLTMVRTVHSNAVEPVIQTNPEDSPSVTPTTLPAASIIGTRSEPRVNRVHALQ